MKQFFFIFNEFDPINEYLLNLVEHASSELHIKTVHFIYDNFLNKENVFIPEEKILLINAAIDSRQSCQFIIDGNSFQNKNWTFLDRVIDIKKRHDKHDIYWLLTSKQYNLYKEYEDFKVIFGLVNIVLYVFPEDSDCVNDSLLTREKVIFINKDENIKSLEPSIFTFENDSFAPIVLEYMNASTECAVKRIKALQLKDRFSHSLRVAGTIKKMCELTNIEDQNFYYKCYMSAIYHDICKNIHIKKQIYIAKSKLHILNYPSPKVLHGLVGAWYLRNVYFYKDEDVLRAVEEHTIPRKNTTLLVKYLYLADKLELGKQEDYSPEEYSEYWKLITENKIDEAFEKLRNKFDDYGNYEQLTFKS